MHDGWAPYRKYDCTHALYKAHALRDLIFQAETRDAPFAPSLIDVLREANTEAARSAQRHIRRAPAPLSRTYDRIVDHAQRLPSAQPSTDQPGRAKQSDTVDLLRRLHDPAEDVCASSPIPRAFDNNQAERAIRMPKTQTEDLWHLRSPEGAATFCTMRYYLATLPKQSRDLFEPHLQRRTS